VQIILVPDFYIEKLPEEYRKYIVATVETGIVPFLVIELTRLLGGSFGGVDDPRAWQAVTLYGEKCYVLFDREGKVKVYGSAPFGKFYGAGGKRVLRVDSVGFEALGPNVAVAIYVYSPFSKAVTEAVLRRAIELAEQDYEKVLKFLERSTEPGAKLLYYLFKTGYLGLLSDNHISVDFSKLLEGKVDIEYFYSTYENTREPEKVLGYLREVALKLLHALEKKHKLTPELAEEILKSAGVKIEHARLPDEVYKFVVKLASFIKDDFLETIWARLYDKAGRSLQRLLVLNGNIYIAYGKTSPLVIVIRIGDKHKSVLPTYVAREEVTPESLAAELLIAALDDIQMGRVPYEKAVELVKLFRKYLTSSNARLRELARAVLQHLAEAVEEHYIQHKPLSLTLFGVGKAAAAALLHLAGRDDLAAELVKSLCEGMYSAVDLKYFTDYYPREMWESLIAAGYAEAIKKLLETLWNILEKARESKSYDYILHVYAPYIKYLLPVFRKIVRKFPECRQLVEKIVKETYRLARELTEKKLKAAEGALTSLYRELREFARKYKGKAVVLLHVVKHRRTGTPVYLEALVKLGVPQRLEQEEFRKAVEKLKSLGLKFEGLLKAWYIRKSVVFSESGRAKVEKHELPTRKIVEKLEQILETLKAEVKTETRSEKIKI